LIRSRALAVGVGAASVTEIDRLNIYHATHLAMRRAIARVGEHDHVLVDGNRIAGFEAKVGPYSAIVKGDAKVYSIACASVVAKVVRDRMMTLLAARYPGYGWERNQGYATLEHRLAIRELGLTPFHRRSFLALQRTLAGDQLGLFGDLDELSDALSDGFEADVVPVMDPGLAPEAAELERLVGAVPT
jgi:ribonuclease HII